MKGSKRKSFVTFIGMTLAFILLSACSLFLMPSMTVDNARAAAVTSETVTITDPTEITLSVNTDRVNGGYLTRTAFDGLPGVEKTAYGTWVLPDETEYAVPEDNGTYYAFVSNAAQTSSRALKFLTNLTITDGTNTETVSCAADDGISVEMTENGLVATYKGRESTLRVNAPAYNSLYALIGKCGDYIDMSASAQEVIDKTTVYYVGNNGFVGNVAAGNNYRINARDISLEPPYNFGVDDIKHDADTDTYYYNVVNTIRGNGVGDGTFTVRVRYSGITKIELTTDRPSQAQTALKQFNPWDIDVYLYISDADYIQLNLRDDTEQGADSEFVLDADGYYNNGLGKFKMYYYDTADLSAVDVSGKSDTEKLDDGTHILDGHMQEFMSSAVKRVRIVYAVMSGKGQPETKVAVYDYDVDGIEILPAVMSAPTVSTSLADWKNLEQDYAEINGQAQADLPFDGYGGEVRISLPIGFDKLETFLNEREVLMTVTRDGAVVGKYGYNHDDRENPFAQNNGLVYGLTESGAYYLIAENVGDYDVSFDITGPDFIFEGSVKTRAYSFNVEPMQGTATLEMQDTSFFYDEAFERASGSYDFAHSVSYQPKDTALNWNKVDHTSSGASDTWTSGAYESTSGTALSGAAFTYKFLFSGQSTNPVWYNESAPSENVPVMPGKYNAYVVVSAFGNYAEAMSEPIAFEIKRQSISFSWDETFPVYDGSNIDPNDYLKVFNNNRNTELLSSDWTFYSDENFSVELAENPKKAGDYTLYFALVGEASDLYEWDPDDTHREGEEFYVSDDKIGKAKIIFTIDKYTDNSLGVDIDGWVYSKDNEGAKTPAADTSNARFYDVVEFIYVTGDVFETAQAALTGNTTEYKEAAYILENGLEYTTAQPQNAGTYYVLAYITSEYKYESGKDDYTSYNYCEANKRFVIEKASIERVQLPAGSYIYDENGHTLTFTAAENFDGDIMRVSGITAAKTGNTPTYTAGSVSAERADVYTITVTLDSAMVNNYKWKGYADNEGADIELTWTILRKAYSAPAAKELTYIKDTAQDVKDTSGKLFSHSDFQKYFEISAGTASATKAGDYTVTLTLTDNYHWAGESADPSSTSDRSKDIPWKISPVEFDKLVASENTTFTYDAARHDFALEGADVDYSVVEISVEASPFGKDGAKFASAAYSLTQGTESSAPSVGFTYAGTYVVTVGFKSAYSGDYKWQSEDSYTTEFTALQREIGIAWSAGDDGTIDGDKFKYIYDKDKSYKPTASAVVTGLADGFTVTLGLNTAVKGDISAAKDIGDYTITVTAITGDELSGILSGGTFYMSDNFKLPSSVTKDFYIAAAVIDAPVLIDGDGSAIIVDKQSGTVTVIYKGAAYKFGDEFIANYAGVTDAIGSFISVSVDGSTDNVLLDAKTYAITVSLNNDNYTWTTGGLDPFTYTVVINPAELEVEWDTLSKTYDGNELAPQARLANTFATNEDKALTISVEVYAAAGDGFGTLTDGKAVNAGYYHVRVTGITGTNYKLPDTIEGTTLNRQITVNRQSVAKPEFVSGDFTYNKAVQNIEINGYRSDIMDAQTVGEDVAGEEITSAALSVSDGRATLDATRAGTYTVTVSLDNNYYWADTADGIDLTKPVDTIDLTKQILRAEVEAPTILRGIERVEGQLRIPELGSGTGIVIHTIEEADTWKTETVSLTSVNGIAVSVNVVYGIADDDVGIKNIKLTIAPEGESIYDYYFAKEVVGGNTMTQLGLSDTFTDGTYFTELTIRYRITGSTFVLEFDLKNSDGVKDGWIYGDIDNTFCFETVNNIPNDYTLVSLSLTYQVKNGESWENVSGDFFETGNTLEADSTYKIITVDKFPRLAGTYRALITYTTNEGAAYEENQLFFSKEFTVEKRELSVDWKSAGSVFYDSANNTFTVTYDASSHMGAADVGNVVYGDSLTFEIGLASGESDPVNAGEYTVSVKSFSGTGAENYVLPADLTAALNIAKREVAVKVKDSTDGYRITYGDSVPVIEWEYVGDTRFCADTFDGANNIRVVAVGDGGATVNTYTEVGSYTLTFYHGGTPFASVLADGTDNVAEFDNYLIAFDGDRIAIEQREIEITVKDQSTSYGASFIDLGDLEDGNLITSASTFANGEYLDAVIELSSDCVTSSGEIRALAGSCSPIVVKLINKNYKVKLSSSDTTLLNVGDTANAATYSITEATLTVNASDILAHGGAYDGADYSAVSGLNVTYFDNVTGNGAQTDNGNAVAEKDNNLAWHFNLKNGAEWDKENNPDSGWTLTLPTVKNAGTYYLYYYVTADNHETTEIACVTVTIDKVAVVVSAYAEIYYGQTAPDETQYTLVFDGIIDSEKSLMPAHISDGNLLESSIDGVTGSMGSAQVSAEYSQGDGVNTYAVTLTLDNMHATNYTFTANNAIEKSYLEVVPLPITVTIDNLSNQYMFGGGAQNKWDLNNPDGDVGLSVAVKDGTADIAGNPITVIYGVVSGTHPYSNIFTLKTDALTFDGSGNVTGTNTVGGSPYDIIMTDKNANYDIEYASSTYTVTNAFITPSLGGYNGAYDEASHSAVLPSVDGGKVASTVDGCEFEITYALSESETAPSDSAYGAMPEIIDAGTYRVYYKITAANHETATGHVTATISQTTLEGWDVGYDIAGWTYGGYNETANAETIPVTRYSNKSKDTPASVTVRVYEGAAANGEPINTRAFTLSATPSVADWLSATKEGKSYSVGQLLAAGTYTVTYELETNPNFTVPLGLKQFTVAKKELQLTPDKIADITYGDLLDFTSFTYTVNGYVNGENFDTLIEAALGNNSLEAGRGNDTDFAQYEAGAARGGVGEYYIRFADLVEETLGDLLKNYAAVLGTSTFDVTPKALTVHINDATNKYNFNVSAGDAYRENPAEVDADLTDKTDRETFGYYYTGDARPLAGDKPFTVVTDAFVYDDGNIIGTNDVAEYAIYAADISDNYTVTFEGSFDGESGKFTVTQAEIRLKVILTYRNIEGVVQASVDMDDTDRSHTGYYNGYDWEFVAVNEAVSGVAFEPKYEYFVNPDYVSAESAPKDAGSYRITFEATENGNYTFLGEAYTLAIERITVELGLGLYDSEESSTQLADSVEYKGGAYTVKLNGTPSNVPASDRDRFSSYFDITYSKDNTAIDGLPTHTGTYMATASVNTAVSDNFVISGTSGTYIFNIIKQKITPVANSSEQTSPEYSGGNHTFEMTNTSNAVDSINGGNVMSYEIEYRDNLSGSTTQNAGYTGKFTAANFSFEGLQAGRYIVGIKLNYADDYEWGEVTDSTADASVSGDVLTLTYTIAQKTLYVKTADEQIEYGDEFDGKDGHTLIYSGLVSGDRDENNPNFPKDKNVVNADAVTFTTSDTAGQEYTSTVNAGATFSIIPERTQFVSNNYGIVVNGDGSGELRVIGRTIYIEIGDVTPTYNGRHQTVSGTDCLKEVIYDGQSRFVNGQGLADLNVTFIVGDGSNAINVNEDGYRIHATSGNGNYDVAFSGSWKEDNSCGTLKIRKAELTLTVGVMGHEGERYTAVYGETLEYNIEYSNFIPITGFNKTSGVITDLRGLLPEAAQSLSVSDMVVTANASGDPYAAWDAHVGESFAMSLNELISLTNYTVVLRAGEIDLRARKVSAQILEGGVTEFKADINCIPEAQDAKILFTNVENDGLSLNQSFLPVFAYSYSGKLANGVDVAGAKVSHAGSYGVTVSLTNGDYIFDDGNTFHDFGENSFTINQKVFALKWGMPSLNMQKDDTSKSNTISDFDSAVLTFGDGLLYNGTLMTGYTPETSGTNLSVRVSQTGDYSITISVRDIAEGDGFDKKLFRNDYAIRNASIESGASNYQVVLTFTLTSSEYTLIVRYEKSGTQGENGVWEYGTVGDTLVYRVYNGNSGSESEVPQTSTVKIEYYRLSEDAIAKLKESEYKYGTPVTNLSDILGWTTMLSERPTNAGAYLVYVSTTIFDENEQEYIEIIGGSAFVIEKRGFDVPTFEVTGANTVYTGNQLSATVVGYRVGFMSMQYDLAYGSSASDGITTLTLYALDAGDHVLTVSLMDFENYKWNDSALGSAVEVSGDTVTITWHIDMADNTVINGAVGSATYGDTFDRSAVRPTFAGEDIIFAYAANESNDSDTPTDAEFEAMSWTPWSDTDFPKNVGKYWIRAVSPSDDKNYRSSTAYIAFAVDKAELVVRALNVTLTYGDDFTLDYEITGGKYGEEPKLRSDFTLGYTVSNGHGAYVAGSDVGVYDIELSASIPTDAADGNNYTVRRDATKAKLTVEKKSIVLQLEPQTSVYSGEEPEVGQGKNTAWKVADGYALFGNDNLSVTVVKAAGVNVGSYALSGTADSVFDEQVYKNGNYDITAIRGGSFTITPLTIVMTSAIADGTLRYNHGGAVGDLTLTLAWNGNSKVFSSASAEQYAIFGTKVALRYGGLQNNGATYSTQAAMPTQAGTYTVSLVLTENTENIVLVNASAPFVVEKMTLDGSAIQALSALQNVLSITYDGSEHRMTDTGAKTAIEGTSGSLFGMSGLYAVERSDSARDVGPYTFTLKIPDEMFCNYKWLSVEIDECDFSFEITQATNTVEWTAAALGKEWVYDGTLHYDLSDVRTDFDIGVIEFLISADNGATWVNFDSVHTYAGTFRIKAVIPESLNYKRAETADITSYTVDKREITITLNGGDAFIGGTYGDTDLRDMPFAVADAANVWTNFGSADDLLFTFGGTSFAGNDFTDREAGIYTVTVSLTGVSAQNFVIDGSEPGTYIIARKAVYGDSADIDSFDFDGKPHTADDAAKLADDYDKLYKLAAGSADISEINAGTYDFELELIDPMNYYWFRNSDDATAEQENVTTIRSVSFTIRTVAVERVTVKSISFKVNGVSTEKTIESNEIEGFLWTYGDNVTDVSATVEITVTVDSGESYTLESEYTTAEDFVSLRYLRQRYSEWGIILPTNAGDHSFRVRVDANTNFKAGFAESAPVSFYVQKKALEIPTLERKGDPTLKAEWSYTGDELTAVLDTCGNDELISISYRGSWSQENGIEFYATNAGSYIISVSILSTADSDGTRISDNYMWAGEDASRSTVTVVWEIAKAANKIKEETFVSATVTYGDANPFAAEADFGTVAYRYYDKDGREIVGTPRTVGEYTVEAYVIEDDNWQRAAAVVRTYTVNKKALTLRPTDSSVVYGEELDLTSLTFLVEDEDNAFVYGDGYNVISGAPMYETEYSAGKGVNAKYEIYFGNMGTLSAANYSFRLTGVGTLSVTKRPVTVIVGDQRSGYGQSAALNPAVWTVSEDTPIYGNDRLSVELYFATPDELAPTVSGIYPIGGRAGAAAGSANANYEFTFVRGTYTVVAVLVTVDSVNLPENLVYGSVSGKEATFTVNGKVYKNGDIIDGKYQIIIIYYDEATQTRYDYMPVNAGTYRVLVERAEYREGMNDNINCTLGGALSALMTIAKQTVSVEEITSRIDDGLLNVVYNGREQSPSAEVMNTIMNYSPIGGLYTATPSSGTDVGSYPVTLAIAGDYARNYKWSDTDGAYTSISFNIVKMTGNTLTATLAPNAVPDGSGEFTVTAFEYDFNNVSSRIAALMTMSSVYGTPVLEYASVSEDGSVGEFTATAPTAVGEYRVRAVIADTGNYNGVTGEALAFSVTPRRVMVTLNNHGGTYSSAVTPVAATFEFVDESFGGLTSSIDYAVYYYGTSNDGSFDFKESDMNITMPLVAGKYLAAVVSRNSNIGFLLADGSYADRVETDFTVAKAEVDADAISVRSLTYNGREQAAIDAVESSLLYGISGGDTAARDAGNYRVTLRLNDFDNYEWKSTAERTLSLAWTIERVRIAIPYMTGEGSFTADDDTYTFVPDGFDSAYMEIRDNTASKNGVYTALVALRDAKNYEWNNGSTAPLEIEWTLEKPVPVDFIVTVSVLGGLCVAAGALLTVMLIRRRRPA